jgi:hypothetical protein
MHEDRPITQRDPRFGGNMERSNVGAQYAGASRDFYGGPSRGSPMLDQRYENYQAPHRVDYTRNIPRQTGTPNFGGRDPGGRVELPQGMIPFQPYFGAPPSSPKQHPNPRMRGMRGMGGGLGGLEQAAVDPSDWRTILKILQAGGDPGTETKAAQMGGYGYDPSPKSYDDIYKGTDIIDMEVLPGAGYGPDDEYDFDYERNRFEDFREGKWPQYVARGGLMSLRR